MRGVILDIRQKMPRDNFFLRDGRSEDGLIEHMKNEVRAIVDVEKILEFEEKGDNSEDATLFMDEDLLQFASRSFPEGSGGVLVLSPFRGPICRNRIRGVLQTVDSQEGSIVVANRKMEHNRNPQWVNQAPLRYRDKENFSWHWRLKTVRKLDLTDVLDSTFVRSNGDTDRPAGSQWLTDFYTSDAAVAYLPEQLLNGEHLENVSWSNCFVEPDPANLHWMHRLPVFTFSANTRAKM